MSSKPLVGCWLDKSIGEANTNLPLKKHFEGVSNRIVRWHYFDCGDQFTDFINDNPNVRLVAIMSGGFAKTILSSVADRDALHSVYVFCGNIGKYATLQDDEPKVKAVLNSDIELFNKMQSDLQNELP